MHRSPPPFARLSCCETIKGMNERGTWMLVAALLGACGGSSKPMTTASSAGMDAAPEVDSWAPDSGQKPDAAPAHLKAGGAGTAAESGGGGTEAGNGGELAYANGGAGVPAPSGGAGTQATGGTPADPDAGQPAPTERVLWSQSWTVAIHSSSAMVGYKNATMGLALDAGDLCRFGFSGSPSGSSQEYPADGACISEAARGMVAGGSAIIFDSAGMNAHGMGGRAPLAGWTEAVTGHSVTKLRRSQTYTVQLLGAGDTSYNYADFEGKWEAIGR